MLRSDVTRAALLLCDVTRAALPGCDVNRAALLRSDVTRAALLRSDVTCAALLRPDVTSRAALLCHPDRCCILHSAVAVCVPDPLPFPFFPRQFINPVTLHDES